MARTFLRALVAAFLPSLVVAACGKAPEPTGRSIAVTAAEAAAPAQGRPDDGFVGSDTCKACHAEEHASWHRSFHRTMTQIATSETVRAPFTGQTHVNRGRAYQFHARADGHFVRIRAMDEDQPKAVERRIVMTTGSHHMQVYWAESGTPHREQSIVPFVYMFEAERWIPREDAFIYPPHEGVMPSRWNDGCIRCHTTGGQPGYDALTGHFNSRVAELGIACEACHGPGRDHVTYFKTPEAERTDAPERNVVQPALLPDIRQAQVCGQCHAISGPPTKYADERWLETGYTYRAGDDLWLTRGITRHPAKAATEAPRTPTANFAMDAAELRFFFWPDGQVRVSGREYNGLLESACYQHGGMTCLSCHSMHQSEPEGQLTRGRAEDTACLECHAEIAKDVPAHTHHGAGSSGSSCVNCHMPHTTYGLLKAIRSHEIASPSVAESLPPIRRPNACNLCHLDQSLAWTAEHLSTWYGHKKPKLGPKATDRAASTVWLAQGDAGQRALLAWHMGWPAAQAASGRAWLAPHLSMAVSSDPYAAVRYIAARSLRGLPGYQDWDYDFLATQAERTKAGQAAYALWKPLKSAPAARKARLGFTPDGSLDLDAAMRLQRRRDDRPVFLGE